MASLDMTDRYRERWTLPAALVMIRRLQPLTRLFGYHLCLGGGVMNKGKSDKDLDLYFLPLEDNNTEAQPERLLGFLMGHWGAAEDIIGEEYLKEAGSKYVHKKKFQVGTAKNLRIDIFVM